MKDRVLLTIVIPTYNGSPLLRHCLRSLQGAGPQVGILVVDDGSTDDTQEMLRREFPAVHCQRTPHNQGFARAVNLGIRNCSTPYLALLNNDTEADSGWVAEGLRALQSMPEFSFFACRLLQFERRDRLDSAGDCYDRWGLPYKRGFNLPATFFRQGEPVLGASAGAAFYRRSLFREVGLFEEGFHMYLEDVELSLRAQLAGHPCFYLPEAVVYHREAASDPSRRRDQGRWWGGAFYSPRRVYWITRNRWLLMLTYQPPSHLPWLLGGWTRSFLFHALKAGYLGAFLRGLAGGLKGSHQAWAKRSSLRAAHPGGWERLWRLIRQC